MDLRTRYSELSTLTSQYIRFISETLRRMEEEEVGLPGWGGRPAVPPRCGPWDASERTWHSTAHPPRPGTARLSPWWLLCAPGRPWLCVSLLGVLHWPFHLAACSAKTWACLVVGTGRGVTARQGTGPSVSYHPPR